MGSPCDYYVVLALAAVAAMPLAGCKTHPMTPAFTPKTIDVEPPAIAAPLDDVDARLFGSEGLRKVFFDYDSAELPPVALETLTRNAELLKGAPGVRVLIEGHCDERGTQEYNLVLGERRAMVVKEQLVRLGVAPERLSTISYGKEKPAMQGRDEAAWLQNRRCEFVRPPA